MLIKNIKDDLISIKNDLLQLDKSIVIIFISTAVLQTISWYYTSRRFFRAHFYYDLVDSVSHIKLMEYLYWFLGDFISFFILPLLLIKFVLKENFQNYGLSAGNSKAGLRFSLLFLIVMLPVTALISGFPDFANLYPHLESARSDWIIFIIFEAGLLIYMFAWEFIWRGYLLFGLEKKFGIYAVFIQMIPFVILHNGKPDIETFGAIFGGIALGLLALKTRSVLYGVAVHFGVIFSLDLFSVLRFRGNETALTLEKIGNQLANLFY